MSIVQLHQPKPCHSVVDGLRGLADRIEAGEIEWPITTAVVCLGHSDSEGAPDEDLICRQQHYWDTYGYGTRTDSFTVRGLLMTIINDWGSN